MKIEIVETLLELDLTGSEYKAMFAIILEHLKQRGQRNGTLIVTRRDFIEIAKIHHHGVTGAIQGLEAKGLSRSKGGEYNPATGRRNSRAFTLTFLESTKGNSDFDSLPVRKPAHMTSENRHNVESENRHNVAQSENRHNYLDDLPLPSMQGGGG